MKRINAALAGLLDVREVVLSFNKKRDRKAVLRGIDDALGALALIEKGWVKGKRWKTKKGQER